MPDEKLVTPEERIQERQRQAAREAAAAEATRDQPADETVPGGRYMVGDQLVDSEGKPVKDKKD